jgi:iron complex transport system substrate-binding protein
VVAPQLRRKTRSVSALAILLASACALAACGSSSKASGSPTASRDQSATTLPAGAPTRVISLSPTATEMLYAIGAGPQVKAVDDQSTYPPAAPRTKLSGYQPNAEAIAGYAPDLVVMSDAAIAPRLKALHIEVLVQPAAATLDDTYKEITALGAATGHATQAKQLVAKMRSEIAALVEKVPADAGELSYYYELDNTYYTVTSHTFIGQLFALAKLHNVADAADQKDSGGYPQLSAEYVVQQNPDLVFLADTKCCKQNAQTAAQRPGWKTMKAVSGGNVVALDDDIASRWGPRVVDLLRAVVQAANKARRG